MGTKAARVRAEFFDPRAIKSFSAAWTNRVAARHGFGKYYTETASGLCKNQKRWVLVSAADETLVSMTPKSIALNAAKLRSICSFSSARFVKDIGGSSRLIRLPEVVKSDLTIQTGFLDAGTLLVMCRYKNDPANRLRPLLQIPIGNPSELPASQAFSKPESAAALISTWINQIREMEKLKPYSVPTALKPIEELTFAIDPFQRIPIRPKDLAGKLAEQKWHLDTVLMAYGSDPKEAAWGLWHTPEFRDKILDKKLSAMMIATKQNFSQIVVYVLMLTDGTRR
jgi:hypothetical protein